MVKGPIPNVSTYTFSSIVKQITWETVSKTLMTLFTKMTPSLFWYENCQKSNESSTRKSLRLAARMEQSWPEFKDFCEIVKSLLKKAKISWDKVKSIF